MLIATLALVGLAAMADPVMVPVAPGETLAVTVTGAPDTPTALLVPGLAGCTYSYRRVIAGLADDGCRTVSVEPLGIGQSARPGDADYTLAAQTARLAAVADSLGLRAVVVVSQGVATGMALRLALARPDLVAGIVSIEGGAVESATTPTMRSSLKIAKFVTAVGGAEIVRRRYADDLEACSGDASWIDRATVRQYLRGPGRDLAATLNAFLAMSEQIEPAAIAPHLGEITIPVRVLRGTAEHEGGLDPEEITVLTHGLRDVRVIDVVGAGHFIQEEQPDAVIAAVRNIAKLPPPVARSGAE